jgi:hypothetical protein
MIIASVPDPRKWDRWPEAEALLEPARARGDFPSVLDDDEVLFAVMEGEDLLAVATASRRRDNATGEIYVEVTLIGGRDHRRWLGELDKVIGAAARDAGAERLIAIGRLGWWKTIEPLGWAKCQPVEDHWLFERKLERG